MERNFSGTTVITLLWLGPWFIITRSGLSLAKEERGPAPVSYAAILRQREFWGAALGHFSISYAMYFILTWLPAFLVKAGGFTVSQMAVIVAAIYGIWAVTMALTGVVSDYWIARRGGGATLVRKAFLLTGAIGVIVTIGCSAYLEPRATVWLLGAAAGFFGLSTSTSYAVTTTLAGPRAAGRWAGAQNLAGQLAGTLAPLLTGIIIDRTGAYSWAFTVSAASAALAILAWGVIIRRVEVVQWPRDLANAAPAGR